MTPQASAVLFLLKHFLALFLALVLGWVGWTLVYVALLLVGMVTGQAGGPLAWPAGMLLVFLVVAGVGGGIFLPATAVGRVLSALARWPRAAGAPVAWLAGAVLAVLMQRAFLAGLTTRPEAPVAEVLVGYALWLTLPFAIYWLVTEGPWAFFDWWSRKLGGRMRVRVRRQVGGVVETVERSSGNSPRISRKRERPARGRVIDVD